MQSKGLFAALALFCSLKLFAQPDSVRTTPAIRYVNQFLAGALIGKYGASLSASMMHGIQYKKARVGIGLGYDAYDDWRVMPAFISAGYPFHVGKNTSVLLQLNTGFTKLWQPEGREGTIIRHERGRFFNPMVGFKFRAETWSIYILAGYKFQRIKYDYTYPWWWGTPPVYYVEQDVERAVIQIGFGKG